MPTKQQLKSNQNIEISGSSFDFSGTVDYSVGTLEPSGLLQLETPKEEKNPSSRFFGELLCPFAFKDVSFHYVDHGFKSGGTLTINWKINVSKEEKLRDNNPSSRTFGLIVKVREWLGND